MISSGDVQSLGQQAARYSLVRNLRGSSNYQLSRSVNLFSQWLGRDAKISDLSGDTVSVWLQAMEQKLSARTVAGHRVNLVGLWRFLAEDGLCEAPRQVRKIEKPDPCPVAWTMEELRLLLQQAQETPGIMCDGTPWCVYWEATIRTAYDTGLRRSDLWILRKDQIRPDGIQIRQAKTGRTHQPRLGTRTLELLRQIKHAPPLSWPGKNSRQWYTEWNLLVARARIRPGALQQIRRTGATHLYREHPEDVQRYLGHRTPTMQRHYVDLSLAAPQSNMPPEL